MQSSAVIHFRHNTAMAIAGLIVALAAIYPAADLGWAGLPLILVPLAFAVWAWRSGTDADADGLRVRALLGSRAITWSQVAALVPDERGRVLAALTNGSAVPLTAVVVTDLPRLVAASGQPLADTDTDTDAVPAR
ncbi:hypothetical protein F4553_003301 [Allocatelliglobosispora scoriae]|uniref:Low molecular weight protein antigen 6 PH domain-containing protein n=1 Tax=Allocatelliglobosispora scoriae TaxID=643052 RepID=A0A841BT54_9ACTN|nr:PH domain-containing protein [Allocatelliglobosispora scoriae]MBB5869922.1 hypothetical protein [Allocatelliglobosispora scoriae]